MSVAALYLAQAPIGSSAFALDGVVAPTQYMPRIDVRSTLNRTQSNANVTINASYPIIADQDGVNKVTDTFKMKVEFTALRSVIAADERARLFDETLALLTANKQQILNGSAMFVAV